MALPKRKTSKSRRGMRRSHWHLEAVSPIACPHCHEPTLAHRVCPACGYYDGRQVVEHKEKKKKRA
ncbi:MAG TPA: 50S ribosomal protein L32 [Firmicutes bacterium]|nr:50S ribosomal protein L32 [Bacillota bacterium]